MKTMRTITLALAGFVAAMPALAADKPSFVADGQLTICTTAGFPPLTYLDKPEDTRPVGIDIDLSDALGKLWGAEVRFVTSGFDGLLPSLQSGRCDAVISGIYLNAKRRETYDGASYMKSASVIVVAGKTEGIAAPSDLSGKVVAAEAGSYFLEMLDALNKELTAAGKAPVSIQSYESQVAATQQVLIGRADATLSEEAEARVRAAQTSGATRVAYVYPSEFNYGIYIQKNPADLALLRDALAALRAEGAFDAIAKKYNLLTDNFAVDFAS
jgi:polar amino acid transport system substrate-binding protein